MSHRRNSSALHECVIVRDPEIMGGQPVFAGTRVPIQHLIEYLTGNYSIEEFTEHFPTVGHEQIVELLNRIGELLKNARI